MSMLPPNLLFIKILLTVLLMIGTLPTAVLAEDVVRVGGAGFGLGTMKALAEAYEKSHPGIRIKILPNLGSSGGIKALLHGALDLAISGRPLNKEELKSGAIATECARSPFVFVANRNVTKTDMTSHELEMIYKGQLLKWPDGTRLRLILRPTTDTDTMIVKSVSKNMEQAVKEASARPDMIMAVTDQETADAVARIPGALGSSTITQLETEKYPLKVLSFNGIKPTLDALAKGSYPLSKPLYLVSTPKTSAMALKFVQFARSAKGRAILLKSGAIPTAGDTKIK